MRPFVCILFVFWLSALAAAETRKWSDTTGAFSIELDLQHGRLLTAALEDGKTSTGPAGKQLMAFRREIAHRNVVNVYWTTSKEMRYGVFE